MSSQPEFPNIDTGQTQEDLPRAKSQENLPGVAHVLCGWPLLLVAVGGAIGGALGGLGYGINIAIYKSGMPAPVKVILNLTTGFAMIAIWLVIATMIHLAINPAG